MLSSKSSIIVRNRSAISSTTTCRHRPGRRAVAQRGVARLVELARDVTGGVLRTVISTCRLAMRTTSWNTTSPFRADAPGRRAHRTRSRPARRGGAEARPRAGPKMRAIAVSWMPAGSTESQGLLVGIAEIDPLWFAHDGNATRPGSRSGRLVPALPPVAARDRSCSRTPPTGACEQRGDHRLLVGAASGDVGVEEEDLVDPALAQRRRVVGGAVEAADRHALGEHLGVEPAARPQDAVEAELAVAAAQDAVGRAGHEARAAQVRVERRGVGAVVHQCAPLLTDVQGDLEAEVARSARGRCPSGASARTPVRCSSTRDHREADDDDARPERDEEVRDLGSGRALARWWARRTRAIPRAARSRTTARTTAGARAGRVRRSASTRRAARRWAGRWRHGSPARGRRAPRPSTDDRGATRPRRTAATSRPTGTTADRRADLRGSRSWRAPRPPTSRAGARERR